MAGMPPLSGFLGKLLVLDAVRDPATMPWVWGAILVGSLMTIVGFARAGSTIFWKATAIPAETQADASDDDNMPPPEPNRAGVAELAPTFGLLAVLAGVTVFAGPITEYLEVASAELFDRSGYVDAVMGNSGGYAK